MYVRIRRDRNEERHACVIFKEEEETLFVTNDEGFQKVQLLFWRSECLHYIIVQHVYRYNIFLFFSRMLIERSRKELVDGGCGTAQNAR